MCRDGKWAVMPLLFWAGALKTGRNIGCAKTHGAPSTFFSGVWRLVVIVYCHAVFFDDDVHCSHGLFFV